MGDEADAMWGGEMIEQGHEDAAKETLEKAIQWQRVVLHRATNPKQKARISARITKMEAELG